MAQRTGFFNSEADAERFADHLREQGKSPTVGRRGDQWYVRWSDRKRNSGKANMTKAQRRAKAKRAGAKRRKANAIKAFMKKMNPARKVPAAVKVTKLKGGGFTVKPVRNLGRLRRTVRRVVRRVTRRRARR